MILKVEANYVRIAFFVSGGYFTYLHPAIILEKLRS